MTDKEKIKIAGTLQAARRAGFDIKGFSGVCVTRGAGTQLLAKSITHASGKVSGLFMGSGVEDYTITWTTDDGDEHEAQYSVHLSDKGIIQMRAV